MHCHILIVGGQYQRGNRDLVPKVVSLKFRKLSCLSNAKVFREPVITGRNRFVRRGPTLSGVGGGGGGEVGGCYRRHYLSHEHY